MKNQPLLTHRVKGGPDGRVNHDEEVGLLPIQRRRAFTGDEPYEQPRERPLDRRNADNRIARRALQTDGGLRQDTRVAGLREVGKPVDALNQARSNRRCIARELKAIFELSQECSNRVARLEQLRMSMGDR
jgi:hypothetical protein